MSMTWLNVLAAQRFGFLFFFFSFLCILMLGILQISAVGTLENSN